MVQSFALIMSSVTNMLSGSVVADFGILVSSSFPRLGDTKYQIRIVEFRASNRAAVSNTRLLTQILSQFSSALSLLTMNSWEKRLIREQQLFISVFLPF